jgi:hypothetical protein
MGKAGTEEKLKAKTFLKRGNGGKVETNVNEVA